MGYLTTLQFLFISCHGILNAVEGCISYSYSNSNYNNSNNNNKYSSITHTYVVHDLYNTRKICYYCVTCYYLGIISHRILTFGNPSIIFISVTYFTWIQQYYNDPRIIFDPRLIWKILPRSVTVYYTMRTLHISPRAVRV